MRTFTALFLLALSTPSFAGGAAADALTEMRETEVPQIAETGITAFDSVFMKAKAIHDTLDAIQGKILGVQDDVAVALDLEPGTPIRMTMWELKQRAGGPVQVQMRDNKPYLTVGGTGADEVKAVIAAVNEGVAELGTIPGDLAKLPAQVQQLVAACQAFPGQINPQLLQEAGMNPLQLPKVVKTVATNVKAVTATPKRIELLGQAVQDLLTGIPQGLAATEPPEEAVAVSKGGKKSKPAKGDDSEDALASLDEDFEDEGSADFEEPEEAPAARAASSSSSARSSQGSSEEYRSPVGAMVDDAFDAFRDAEIDSAVQLLAEADQSLLRLSSPVSSGELESLYETAALVHLVDGNATAATASAVQALIVAPASKPSSDLGPEYARLHKALQKSGVVVVVPVDITGDGEGYLSGLPIEGGTRVEVAAGKHLLQRQVNGKWVSELVWVAQGTEIPL